MILRMYSSLYFASRGAENVLAAWQEHDPKEISLTAERHVGRQPRENEHAHDRDQELQRARPDEEVYKGSDDQADQTHE